MCNSAIKLLHHDLAADLVTQEKCAVSRKGADHGGRETRVEGSNTFEQEIKQKDPSHDLNSLG